MFNLYSRVMRVCRGPRVVYCDVTNAHINLADFYREINRIYKGFWHFISIQFHVTISIKILCTLMSPWALICHKKVKGLSLTKILALRENVL